MMKTLDTRIASEFVGTAFLVAAVVGSGIMGERLAEVTLPLLFWRTLLPRVPLSSR